MIYRAIIENNIEPIAIGSQIGRVQVRIFSIHSQDKAIVPTEALPWAEVQGSTAFGLNGGVGVSSVLQIGTWVWVMLEGGDIDRPIVTGTVLGVDPTTSKSDLHDKALEHYGDVQVLETSCGHRILLSDTVGDETIQIKHKSGTLVNISSDGTTTIESSLDMNVTTNGITSFQSLGDIRMFSSGNFMLQANTVQLNSGLGFANPKITDSEPNFTSVVEAFPIPENYYYENEDAPISPENVETTENGEVYVPDNEALSENEIQYNVYDLAIKALNLGEAAWTEKNSSSRSYSNPNIISLWDEINIPVVGDSTAWCATFLSAMLKRSGNYHLQTASSRAYMNYPSPSIDIKDIKVGDICIFWRGSKSDTRFGHVGIYSGTKSDTRITVIGGNQGSPGRLKYSSFPISQYNDGAKYGLLKIVRPIGFWDKTTYQPDAGTSREIVIGSVITDE